MKGLGIFLLIVGIVGAVASFSMDVTVATGYGGRVNNIGLMASKQNYILISCFVILCGFLAVIFGKKRQETIKCPFCAELVNSAAIKCKHCGSNIKTTKQKTSDVNYSFSISTYDLKELIGVKNGKRVINDYAIKKLVFDIKKNNPQVKSSMLKLKYNEELHEVSTKLPSDLRSEFINKVTNILDK